MRKKITQSTNKKKIILFTSLFIFSLTILLVNEFGLVKYIQLSKKHTILENKLNNLLIQQTTLRDNIYQLQNDEDYLKSIAREKFMMVLPGEKVYRVIDEKIMQ
ncbi:hypothetical protein CL659_05785 [bacterium]|nr:hypothetical protein [bacterium]|tara:strand:- start:2175 stop:2486 length:312 start_codon:yes stop_codon:yes gene_type:complete